MSAETYTGRCACGEIRFETTGLPTDASHCHCETCRRSSGAPFVTWVAYPASRFRVTRGQIAERESSPEVMRGYCPDCGTPIIYHHRGRYPNDIDLTAACFDDQSIIEPRAHLWVEDKPDWVVIGDDLPQYAHWRT